MAAHVVAPYLASLDETTALDLLPPARTANANSSTHKPRRDARDIPPMSAMSSSLTPSAAQSPDIDESAGTSSGLNPCGEYEQAPEARYVTVSAILSRCGALLPANISADPQPDIFAAPPLRRHPSHDAKTAQRQKSGTMSSGNALEALGTLLLHRDSKGRASSLSFQKWKPSREATQSESRTPTNFTSTSYKLFFNSLRSVRAVTFGLCLPSSNSATARGGTIAERRAQKRHQENVSVPDDGQGYVRVRTKPDQPTFEVSRSKSQSLSNTIEDLNPDPRAAIRRSHSTTVYGIGSAFATQDPPEAPPTPLGMPGDWPGGTRGSYIDGDEDIALLLPPPLLDDWGSDARSFEGLLGVRRAREQEEARKCLQRLASRNRPTHKVGLVTVLSNFVKAAHAADQAKRALAASRRSATSERSLALNRRRTDSKESARLAIASKRDYGPSREQYAPYSDTKDVSSDTSVSSNRTSIDHSPPKPIEMLHGDVSLDDTNHYPPDGQGTPIAASRKASIVLSEHLPSPPRLLPIQMSEPSSPFTPLDGSGSGSSQKSSDYMSACPRLNGGPNSPVPAVRRVGPTLLSLPPSPWTLHAGTPATSDRSQNQFQSSALALAAQGFSVAGTPRLDPTHLSVLPSPIASQPTTPQALLTVLNSSSQVLPSPTSFTVDASPSLPAAESQLRKRKFSAGRRSAGGSDQPALRIASLSRRSSSKNSSDLFPCPTPHIAGQESFLLWWLAGDLGVGLQNLLQSWLTASESKFPTTSWTALLGLTLGFLHFCLAHFLVLLAEIAESVALTFWFIRWIVLNLTGQTVLSRCVLEAFSLIQAEWSLVAQEDHEERAEHAKETTHSHKEPRRGLTRIQVLRGFIELICLHSVTRSRWMQEGAGLRQIDGWERASRRGLPSDTSEDEEVDEDEDTDIVITRREEDILEFTRTPRMRPRTSVDDQQASGYFSIPDIIDGHSQNPRSSEASLAIASKAADVRSKRSLIRTLKWASRLAIGAYGLHVHIVDLPPTFTPSGDRFNLQTFAHLSRLSNSDDVLHADIQQLSGAGEEGMDGALALYQPTFYVARDHVRKTIVVAVRGTQSFSDVIADLDMRTEKFPLSCAGLGAEERPEQDGGNADDELKCHAGVLRAAQSLIRPDSSLMMVLTRALDDHKDFGLAFVGHSLGAAIASAIVMLLGRYHEQRLGSAMEAGTVDRQSTGWSTGPNESGLPEGRAIKAISFAPPATFSAALSRRAAKGDTPLVLSVVLGTDVIPRAGYGQARELRRVLGALARVRRRHESSWLFREDADQLNKMEATEDARIHIFRSWWKWSKLVAKEGRYKSDLHHETYGNGHIPSRKSRLTKDEFASKQRIELQLWKLRCDVEADLYCAIKARTTGRTASDPSVEGNKACGIQSPRPIPPSPWVGPQERSQAPLYQLAERRQALDAVTLESEAKLGGVLIPAGQILYIDEGETAGSGGNAEEAIGKEEAHGIYGRRVKHKLFMVESPLSFFSLPEFSTSMFASHLPSSYESVLEDL